MWNGLIIVAINKYPHKTNSVITLSEDEVFSAVSTVLEGEFR